jgi:predicted nucleic acid-binding protein
MKATLDLDDELLVRAKALAAREGRSLTGLIEDGLRLRLRVRRQRVGKIAKPEIAVYAGREWPALRRLLLEHPASGNDVSDAWIAAAVQTLGEHLATFDRGFLRLLGRTELTLLNPR